MVMTSTEVEEVGRLSFETAALIGGKEEPRGSKEEEACLVWMLASGLVMGWRVVSGDGGIFRGLGGRRRRRSSQGFGRRGRWQVGFCKVLLGGRSNPCGGFWK